MSFALSILEAYKLNTYINSCYQRVSRFNSQPVSAIEQHPSSTIIMAEDMPQDDPVFAEQMAVSMPAVAYSVSEPSGTGPGYDYDYFYEDGDVYFNVCSDLSFFLPCNFSNFNN